jgi:uncharacterized protein
MDANLNPPFWQFNGHIQTIYPSIFRKIAVPYVRERLELVDGDFLDLDWVKQGSKKLVIVTHGLEGDSSRHYVTGMIKKFTDNGFDGLAWNCRSCSGEINRLPRFYHHGDATDLKLVVEYGAKMGYNEIVLVGFSMGGSLTLRLLGEFTNQLPIVVKAAITASVPLDLPSSVRELYKPNKSFYMRRFLRKLAVKIEKKSITFPENKILNFDNYWKEIKNFDDFDNRYTAPLHGYKNAEEFYQKASAKPFLSAINIPTCIIQAQNDPFLTDLCFDLGSANTNKNLTLLKPKSGGHVGFMVKGQKHTYAENQAWDFYNSL